MQEKPRDGVFFFSFFGAMRDEKQIQEDGVEMLVIEKEEKRKENCGGN